MLTEFLEITLTALALTLKGFLSVNPDLKLVIFLAQPLEPRVKVKISREEAREMSYYFYSCLGYR